ncbi:MAG: hypothetical protein NC131_13480 [Roseburia sp.]|nr:hypothetical protein [Roseburia sp.]
MNQKLILDFASQSVEEIDDTFNWLTKAMRKIFDSTVKPVSEPINYLVDNEDKIITAIDDLNFGTEDYSGDFQNISNFFWYMTETDEVTITKPTTFISSVKDRFFHNISLARWLRDKQVFEFSDELIESLISNDKPIIDDFFVEWLNYMPFRSFLLDFSNNKHNIIKGNFSAVLVYIYNFGDNNFCMDLTEISKEGRSNGYYKFGVPKDELNGKPLDFSRWGFDCRTKSGKVVQNYTCMSPENIYAIFQILMYLSSKKPDCVKSDTTKQIYRGPTRFVKNRPREICSWNVGFRYAESVKKISESVSKGGGNGTGKRPHIRKAHWHKYWVGKGRKILELKWIDQCGVNMDFDTDLPYVSHEEM